MRIANNKKTKLEADFNVSELDNHPSCLVIIDNRKDRQIIAIERNIAFSKVVWSLISYKIPFVLSYFLIA